MGIWVEYDGNLILCDVFSVRDGKYLYAYPAAGGEDGPVITIKADKEKIASIYDELSVAVATGKTYVKIPKIEKD